MTTSVRISSVKFKEFKALKQFTLSLDQINILVGPNNSGKSTILGAFRALHVALRTARGKKPQRLDTPTGRAIGYHINEESLPISLENVHTDYSGEDTCVTFRLSNDNKLHLHFPNDGGCLLVPDARDATVQTASGFRRAFPVTLAAVPVLGPVEHNEPLKERSTVLAGLFTHRASRHFRSYWHHFPDSFDEFASLVADTWPGMEVQRPERRITGELDMFCLEDRITRELYWSGFGFQIWCQLLTHVARARGDTMLIVDEPEIYLHPDVQRQLLSILRQSGPDIILATHSTELMSEADAGELVLIDKRRQVARRLKEIAEVQNVLNVLGSVHNITLTTLARNRRVVFVEGESDFSMLRRFARKLGYKELGAGIGLTALESGGFGSWKRVTTLANGIGQALGSPLKISAVYDRDYFCDEEIAHVLNELRQGLQCAHVHLRKEMENYLLVPDVLDRAIERSIRDRSSRANAPVPTAPASRELLKEITDVMRDEVQAQYIARRTNFLRNTGIDVADLTRVTLAWFNERWTQIESRVQIVPGKDVLAALRQLLRERFSINLTDVRIVDAFHIDEIPTDLVGLLKDLDAFRVSE